MKQSDRRLRRHIERCSGEVTTMMPPGAEEGQLIIEFCDHGYWFVHAIGSSRGGTYRTDKGLPDAFWEAVEEAESTLRKAGLDHLAGSLRRLLTLVDATGG